MICIAIAAKIEWLTIKRFYGVNESEIHTFPFGEFFIKDIHENQILFYFSGNKKANASAAAQYMILLYRPDAILVMGTCAGINRSYQIGDILFPCIAVQYDCTVNEVEPFIKEEFKIKLNTENLNTEKLNFTYQTGTIGTADKAVVLWEDYLKIKTNNIDIADMESAAIAYVCQKNNINCLIMKGISDFPYETLDSYDEQCANFHHNAEIVMTKMCREYLPEVLEYMGDWLQIN